MSHEEVPPPVSLREALHRHHGTRPTLVEEATIEFEAYLRANGGKLRPLTGADLGVPEPPNLGDAIRAAATNKEKK
jgi:hypothetical protein